ncbi:MAG: hypothetical protein QOF39_3605 [Frankiales bacterium]|jgi:hypothetical protein|nr:hypothetical protein [Frankiales bacterium]
MIWQTWRQHRAEASVAAFILVVVSAVMVAVGNAARSRAHLLGLPGCLSSHGDCSNALEQMHQHFHTIPPITGSLIAVPLLAGMFWAAPLVSREYEAGTHRLAWTQSVAPLRWITTKLILIFSVLALAALVLGILAAWTLSPLSPAFGGRYNSTLYDIQGVVPVACMLFALALGVATSALIRRTIPAMAVTLVGYAAARIPVHFFRAHLAPFARYSATVPVRALTDRPGGSPQSLGAATLPPGAWVNSVSITDSAGHSIATGGGNLGLLLHFCPDAKPDSAGNIHVTSACQRVLDSSTVHETVLYHPSSHFWLLQAVESTLFLGLAAVLVTVAVLVVTGRHPV